MSARRAARTGRARGRSGKGVDLCNHAMVGAPPLPAIPPSQAAPRQPPSSGGLRPSWRTRERAHCTERARTGAWCYQYSRMLWAGDAGRGFAARRKKGRGAGGVTCVQGGRGRRCAMRGGRAIFWAREPLSWQFWRYWRGVTCCMLAPRACGVRGRGSVGGGARVRGAMRGAAARRRARAWRVAGAVLRSGVRCVWQPVCAAGPAGRISSSVCVGYVDGLQWASLTRLLAL